MRLPRLGALILLIATLTALYWRVIVGLVNQWLQDPDYSHGFLVPFLAGWMLWRSRARLRETSRKPSWWGLPIIVGAMGLLMLGSLGSENYLSRVSLLIVTAGLVINFYGWPRFRAGVYAWLVLFLMIPLPAIVSNRIVLPLQFLSSGLASSFMDFCGMPVYREGNIIYLPSITLEVAQACSGIRSLMAMVTVAVAYGYLLEQKPWRRTVLILGAIPIAVLVNSVRIMTSGFLGQYWGREKAEGFFHLFSGLAIFSFSLLLLWMLHLVLRKFGVEHRGESLA
jgi:exosortase